MSSRVLGGWARWFTVWGMAATLGVGACSGKSNDDAAAPGGGLGAGSLVDLVSQRVNSQIDLLLVVDNSASMLDKQQLLAQAMPLLLARLVTPICVSPCTDDTCTARQAAEGIPVGGNADAEGRCAVGEPEMAPVTDLHVGVISSSLGSHGAMGADDFCTSPQEDDHAHLLGEVRGTPPTWDDSGFLAWDSGSGHMPPGDSDLQEFSMKLQASVLSAGEAGCNYEAPLEAWYRFLIDPEPPRAVLLEQSTTMVSGIDETVLAQRAAFLRPNSLVAIVMLTDENDCSVVDEGYGWLVTRSGAQYRSTSQCLANPNDQCCQSCGETTANPGCPAIANDVECAKSDQLIEEEDHPNLRCWEQKRRFGFDLLYPISRYADALRQPVVTNSLDEMVPNPLFLATAGSVPRDRGQVFLAALVGVPWQDLADNDSIEGPGLRYLTAAELTSESRWELIIGDALASPPRLPTDPLMIETTQERQGQNPVTGAQLVPATGTDPSANPINGHEQVNVDDSDLQYACIFPLPELRVCDEAARAAGVGCDCFDEAVPFNRPVCQPPGGGAAGITQYSAKAYPGLRQLRVLREFGENAIPASICPKVVDQGSPDYGYNPAVNALVARIRDALRPRCFPRPLNVSEEGETVGMVACTLVEVQPELPGDCDCSARGLASLDGKRGVASEVQSKLAQYGYCGVPGGPKCSELCMCELPQATGDELVACQNAARPSGPPAFCFINASPDEQHVGNPDLVANCPASDRRLLHIIGDAPAPDAELILACEPSATKAAPEPGPGGPLF